MSDDVDVCEFVVGDLDANGVRGQIEFASDFEAGSWWWLPAISWTIT